MQQLFSPYGQAKANILKETYLNRHGHRVKQGWVEFAHTPRVKDVLTLNGRLIRGVPIYVTPRGNDRTVFFISGYQATSPDSIQKELSPHLQSYGDILNWFFPQNGEDEYLGFCYVLISGKDSLKAAEINGTVLQDESGCLTVRKATLKSRILRAKMSV